MESEDELYVRAHRYSISSIIVPMYHICETTDVVEMNRYWHRSGLSYGMINILF